MRPQITELCNINPRELRLLTHEQASLKIIDALKDSKREMALELHKICSSDKKDYDILSSINYKIMYIDKAIEARVQDYEEMMA